MYDKSTIIFKRRIMLSIRTKKIKILLTFHMKSFHKLIIYMFNSFKYINIRTLEKLLHETLSLLLLK